MEDRKMHIYRHKENKKLYTITHVVYEYKFLDGNGHSGIVATPYKWNGKDITYLLQDYRDWNIEEFNPKKFVEDNFEIVGERLQISR